MGGDRNVIVKSAKCYNFTVSAYRAPYRREHSSHLG